MSQNSQQDRGTLGDLDDLAPAPDDATIAGSTGFVLSIDWEGFDYILRVLGGLDDLLVAVTTSGEDPPFDARVRSTDDGIAFEPWDADEDKPTGEDLVFFDVETIDGLHVY